MNKPVIVTLTGPCCSGKSTLARALAARGFLQAVTTTTRKPRDGEVDGIAYHFTDRSRFEKMQRDQELVESFEFNGNYYGLTVAEVARITELGKPITVVCEPHGQKQIAAFAMDRGWSVISVFVDVSILTFTRRYLERFKSDIEAGMGEHLVQTYGKRLATAVSDELQWGKSHGADLYIREYCMETQYCEVERIISQVNCMMNKCR